MPQGYTLEQLQTMGKVAPANPAPQGQGLTLQQLQEMGKVAKDSAPTEKPQSYGQQVLSDLDSSGRDIISNIKKRGESLADTATKSWNGEINPLQTGIRTVGTAIGAAGDLLGGGIMAVGKAILPKEAEQSLADTGRAVMNTGVGKVVGSAAQKFSQWEQEHPELAKDVNAVGNIASILPAERLLGVATKGVEGAAAVASDLTNGVKNVAGKVADTAASTAKVAGDSMDVLKSGAKSVGTFIKNAPERLDIAANAIKKDAAALAVEKPAVQRAAESGFSVKEASTIANASPREKFVMRQMNQQAKKVTAGESAKSSADVAGSYLQNRIGEADTVRKQIGQQLGESVKGLKGEVVTSRLKVLDRLRGVQGLEGLTIDNKGNLNFSKTTLSTALTQADRNQINSIWKSIKGRDAYRLHQLRQEIFEVLGGRQKAAVPLTATQEQGFEAIRQGLADAIGEISPQYKALNQKYAQIANPIKNLRKFYRGLENAGGDILDERSGVLLRRLTGNSPSAQNLKQAISEIDAILKANGKASPIDLQKLQDFQNILEREYEDTIKATGLAGQVSLGANKGVMGLLDRGANMIGSKLGSTPELRRKILDELLR